MEQSSLVRRIRRVVFGAPRDLADTGLAHRLALVPFLAWVGLGADGLSSSAYGPEEAFKALGQYPFLALGLAAIMAGTVLLISAAYFRIIEEFPSGGGGYVVASKLLGPRFGVVSGCALLVDYVLTITTSLAAAGDSLFSFLPLHWHGAKLATEAGLLVLLTAINIRGVRESVLALVPVFLLFVVTHALLIGLGIASHLPQLVATVGRVGTDVHRSTAALGATGLVLLMLRAYSLGGGTYTGIEAVSNGLPIMREPRVRTGRRTMAYMASSLAFTAGGLLLCYLLWHVVPVPGKTMNAVLAESVLRGLPFSGALVVATLFAAAALLVVAAQAGFLDGPRVLANMAVDSWVPHRFASLSDRLTTQNGITLMGGAALVALLYTRGDVGHLIVMYSINVFLTFSLSMFAMLRFWLRARHRPAQRRRVALFAAGFVLCATILCITSYEKFAEGGWITLVVTALVITLCLVIRRHYDHASRTMDELFAELGDLPHSTRADADLPPPDPKQPTAGVLVNSYSGVGIHTLLNVFRTFPGLYRNVVFITVGVVDSGEFKGEHAVTALHDRTATMLDQYVVLARGLGVSATGRLAIGTEVVAEAELLCLDVAREFPRVTFFAGKVVFQRDRWWQRVLHNETALAIQKRLQWAGYAMVTLPVRVRTTA
ncbi:MAG: APC family permease [Gemmatimonadales bacterium]